MARQVFARALPPPDPASLLAAVVAIVGAGAAITPEMDPTGVLTIAIDKPTAWAAGEITSVQTAVTAAVAASPALAQQAAIDALPVVLKAILLATIDQLNVLRADVTTLGISRAPISGAAAIAAVRAKAGTL
jgi:hypothetical protein